MSQRLCVLSLTVAAVLCAAPLWSSEDAAIGKDLKATIALQGKTCDQIVSSKRNADSDYAVTCKDGNRYHVFVNGQGRVIVEKQ
jgi:hypothetical protein